MTLNEQFEKKIKLNNTIDEVFGLEEKLKYFTNTYFKQNKPLFEKNSKEYEKYLNKREKIISDLKIAYEKIIKTGKNHYIVHLYYNKLRVLDKNLLSK